MLDKQAAKLGFKTHRNFMREQVEMSNVQAHCGAGSRCQEWLMTASSPLPSLYQGAQGLACPTASISLGTAVTDLL